MDGMKLAVVILTYVLAAGVLSLFPIIAWKMAMNTINLGSLVSEPDGKASLSRFQLLVFTLVIAGLYVVLSIDNGQLLDVPGGALALLGISAGGFVVSKGIGVSTRRSAEARVPPKDKE